MRDTRTTDDLFAQLGPLKRYAYSLTRDRGEAEDLVHDALVKAIECERQFRPGRNARSWLCSILHNTFIDRRRARAVRAGVEMPSDASVDVAQPASQHDALRLQDVRRSFLALPEEQRTALHLVAIEGLSYEDAATTLDIPVGTLVSRVSRARAQLRALDADEGDNVVRFRAKGGSSDASV
ncbi:sigma-70 family RNA polymerase sigma factor [Aureimonas phyllosphaerae]|uniref:RNA polymerase sigma-70 factor (ECF subfamily) n=1 Tax=Aureimonas phyllosphaerae TaxID=1166078 RepID=A0A7W6FU59_9HYPH|nr:sigma-70 family RNA polymerase sigma factor [Aureimonas phyllosphaerae]MBB3935460.1 RNA polymerase sigma-70 factor (ECF subfamily) [Aureimonas phyllosphaerae]MBB3959468.1 RNA polymerase sigma-70 factor (ECF subfamily) [Aureimonas phyllosphaerae]SFF53512.1 RNA polymerase sigma-70 factor, ECF subfamily [Aureimonas phyllosphaerae]